MGRTREGMRRFAAVAALAALVGGCGDGSGEAEPGPPSRGDVLFHGPARGLLPHELGRSALFRAVATAGDSTITATFATRVVEDDGSTFTVEQESESGERSRLHAVDDGSEIRAVASWDEDSGRREITPPAVLVRTPVVAGEPVRSGFRRSLAVVLHTADGDVRRVVPFEGTSERTPLGFADATLDGTTPPDAIRFALVASGRASVPTPVGTIALELEIAGEETLAPGVGLVREEIDLVLRAGGASATARLSTVRIETP